MQKKLIGFFIVMLVVSSSWVLASENTNLKEDNSNSNFLTLSVPDDFELDAYCGGFSLWTEVYRVQIDSSGHGVYSILYPADRDTASFTEIDQFDLTQSALNQLWNEIVSNDFFSLNEVYSESDIFPDSDIQISGGTFANIMVVGDGLKHMVETRHVGVPQFDNIMLAINSITPGDYNLYYNGLYNVPPFTPSTPSGPTSGNCRKEYAYTTSAVDIDRDDLYYRFDWGDGTYSDWVGPYSSGDTVSVVHKWGKQGEYNVRAQVKDDPDGDGDLSDGLESAWSEPLPVTMPRERVYKPLLLSKFLKKIVSLFQLFDFFDDFFKVDTSPKLSLSADAPFPPTEIKLDEANCKITITIRVRIWGEGASDALARSMETAIENRLNKDKNGNPWKLKCPKDECNKVDPGCSVEFDIIIKNAGALRPESGEGYHDYYVAPRQGSMERNPGGKRFVSITMTSDANENDNIVDYPRPNDKTTNIPPQTTTHVIHNGCTCGCLHEDDTVGTWAHEFLHCVGLADKYIEQWTDTDGDGYRDADEVTTRPKPGHEDDIMANATKWLQQWAINKTMERVGIKCPCKCCPEKDTKAPENRIQTPNNGDSVSSPLIVAGYADDGDDGSGVAYLDYKLEWDDGEYNGEGYEVDPPTSYVEYELGPLYLENYIEPGDWITITTYATDAAGNTGEDSVTVTWETQQDTNPPVTEKIIGQPNEQEGYIIWASTPITFQATDDLSGVNHIYYEVWWDSTGDGIVDTLMGYEKIYDDTVTFTVEMWGVYYGYIELRWHAVDNAENIEETHVQEHYVTETLKFF